jgi:serine protein kinase
MEEVHLEQKVFQEIQKHHDLSGKPLSFSEYLRLVIDNPILHLRGAAQYIRDTFDHFGTRTVDTPHGRLKRFTLFDLEFNDGVGRVAGQEEVQDAIYRLLNNFAREGRINRLVLLHGPNGSAKTSLIHAIQKGMEHYSSTSEGSLYEFQWLFPSEEYIHSQIGFGGKKSTSPKAPDKSYAALPGENLDAVLKCDLRDHPLLLIPVSERKKFFESLHSSGGLPLDFPIPDYLWRGELCAKCRQIYDALLSSYRGDSSKVFSHIQIQRLLLSHRYRRGISSIEPQLHVDASEQQITASRGLAALPPSIANLALLEFHGPLVDANRGLLEYNDLLKRPIDTFKYLLVTCENAQVTLERSTLFLDTVFIGSTNEMLLDSFKSYADFASFKGRLELIRVPYLRRVSDEILIYRDQIPEGAIDRHLAPHTLYLASLWAVLTRLRQPDESLFEGELRDVIHNLTPIEKAMLYDRGETPLKLPSSQSKELINAIPDLYESKGQEYEGRSGASAREVRMLLLNSAQQGEQPCVTPLGLFEEIKHLISDKSVFDFLQRKPEGDYLDQDKILEMMEEAYLNRLENEAAEALGMVSEGSYIDLFNRYVTHVSHWLRKDSLLDPITNETIPPDEKMMKEVEGVLRSMEEDEITFRKNLIAKIGAFVLESDRSGKILDAPLNYSRVFPALFDRLKEDYLRKRREIVQKSYQNYLRFMDGIELDPRLRESAQKMHDTLKNRFGYCEACAKEAMAFLLKKRYQKDHEP